jgi:hypothetical protein
MPTYRVFRLKENLRQQFRAAPHLSGVAAVKPKDYEEAFRIEASTPYAAWRLLRGSERELGPGDLLETPEGELRILKYIGFEEARWALPEAKPAANGARMEAESSDENAAIGAADGLK